MAPIHLPSRFVVPAGQDRQPANVQLSHPNFSEHLTQSPKSGSKKVPRTHLLLIVWDSCWETCPRDSTTLFMILFRISSCLRLGVPKVELCKTSVSPLSLTMELRSPPVLPICTNEIEESRQVEVRVVDPVHRHWPLIHAPFLLQWYVQVCLFSQ